MAEADEAAVAAALARQGFRASDSYLTTLRALASSVRRSGGIILRKSAWRR